MIFHAADGQIPCGTGGCVEISCHICSAMSEQSPPDVAPSQNRLRIEEEEKNMLTHPQTNIQPTVGNTQQRINHTSPSRCFAVSGVDTTLQSSFTSLDVKLLPFKKAEPEGADMSRRRHVIFPIPPPLNSSKLPRLPRRPPLPRSNITSYPILSPFSQDQSNYTISSKSCSSLHGGVSIPRHVADKSSDPNSGPVRASTTVTSESRKAALRSQLMELVQKQHAEKVELEGLKTQFLAISKTKEFIESKYLVDVDNSSEIDHTMTQSPSKSQSLGPEREGHGGRNDVCQCCHSSDDDDPFIDDDNGVVVDSGGRDTKPEIYSSFWQHQPVDRVKSSPSLPQDNLPHPSTLKSTSHPTTSAPSISDTMAPSPFTIRPTQPASQPETILGLEWDHTFAVPCGYHPSLTPSQQSHSTSVSSSLPPPGANKTSSEEQKSLWALPSVRIPLATSHLDEIHAFLCANYIRGKRFCLNYDQETLRWWLDCGCPRVAESLPDLRLSNCSNREDVEIDCSNELNTEETHAKGLNARDRSPNGLNGCGYRTVLIALRKEHCQHGKDDQSRTSKGGLVGFVAGILTHIMPTSAFIDPHTAYPSPRYSTTTTTPSSLPSSSPIPVVEVNFLCISHEHRGLGLAPSLIKELARVCALVSPGHVHGVFTAAKSLYPAVAAPRLYHRPLCVSPLLTYEFSQRIGSASDEEMEIHYSLPDFSFPHLFPSCSTAPSPSLVNDPPQTVSPPMYNPSLSSSSISREPDHDDVNPESNIISVVQMARSIAANLRIMSSEFLPDVCSLLADNHSSRRSQNVPTTTPTTAPTPIPPSSSSVSLLRPFYTTRSEAAHRLLPSPNVLVPSSPSLPSSHPVLSSFVVLEPYPPSVSLTVSSPISASSTSLPLSLPVPLSQNANNEATANSDGLKGMVVSDYISFTYLNYLPTNIIAQCTDRSSPHQAVAVAPHTTPTHACPSSTNTEMQCPNSSLNTSMTNKGNHLPTLLDKKSRAGHIRAACGYYFATKYVSSCPICMSSSHPSDEQKCPSHVHHRPRLCSHAKVRLSALLLIALCLAKQSGAHVFNMMNSGLYHSLYDWSYHMKLQRLPRWDAGDNHKGTKNKEGDVLNDRIRNSEECSNDKHTKTVINNLSILQSLGFRPGSGRLKYYLYNLYFEKIHPKRVYQVII